MREELRFRPLSKKETANLFKWYRQEGWKREIRQLEDKIREYEIVLQAVLPHPFFKPS